MASEKRCCLCHVVLDPARQYARSFMNPDDYFCPPDEWDKCSIRADKRRMAAHYKAERDRVKRYRHEGAV